MKDRVLKNGFTLLEVLIGSALILIVFLGIFGGFELALKVVAQSKAKSSAIALANNRIEEIRNLPYKDVGTIGGIPAGTIPQTETQTLNNIKFTIKTTIVYVDDPFDGVAPNDPVPADYKRAKVAISWPSMVGGEVSLITDVAPKGIETTQGGGTLSIIVLDAQGNPLPQAKVNVSNDKVSPSINADYLSDDNGNVLLAGAPTSTEGYKIVVTKDGYSEDRTYSRDEVANPNKPYASVYEGDLTEISFSIDKVSTFQVETRAQESFDDDFNNSSGISKQDNIVVDNGAVRLATTSAGYVSSGYLISKEIAPIDLYNWDSLAWDANADQGTTITCQLYYATGTSWELIPDSDLPGNSAGFDKSPVDLSGLSVSKYSKIKIKGNLSTSDASVTPYLNDWHLYYNTPLIPNTAFHLQGEKIIGTDSNGAPVYKYSKDFVTDSSGKLIIDNLEWDSYNFSATSSNVDLVRVNPANPVNLMPDTTQSVGLYFKAENSLLVKVVDSQTSDPIFGANVRLYNQSLGYDKNLPTDENGNAYFIPLEKNNFDLEVSASGYQSQSTTVFVSGHTTKTIYLTSQ